jgi:hypothetical protein
LTPRYILVLCFSLIIFLIAIFDPFERPKPVLHNLQNNKLGVWLWYLERTSYKSHKSLGDKLSKLGVKRIFIKVSDGTNLEKWPELKKKSVIKEYLNRHIEPWAWSYNYPGNDSIQAHALYEAAKTGYKGFVVDLEKEFDGKPEAAKKLFMAFAKAKNKAFVEGYIKNDFKLYCTTWGNVKDHKTPIAAIDPFVDGYMPQTYIELWGENFMENIKYWVMVGNLEYLALGATKPIYHIVSTEKANINSDQLNEFIQYAGPQTSIWRIPGYGVPESVWKDWEGVDWDIKYDQNMLSVNRGNEVIKKDKNQNSFTIDYDGKLYHIELIDSCGQIAKTIKPNENHIYTMADLSPGKYNVNIYHEKRMSAIPIEKKE